MYWIIGAGQMAREYIKVLRALGIEFVVIGRGENSANATAEQTGSTVITGGLHSFLKTKPQKPEAAIIATGTCELFENTILLLNYGVKKILAEKPLALFQEQIDSIAKYADTAKIYIGYNRRFYLSTQKAKEIILQDNGVTSFHFEFTEWSHKIEPLTKNTLEKERWILANSSHVIDLAFYLAGTPEEIECKHSGTLKWHKSAARFSGSGKTKTGALFSYHADWEAPGRWGIEILTKNNRIILRPLETLQIMKKNSVNVEQIPLPDEIEQNFKPGIYRQILAFINEDESTLCTILHHAKHFPLYLKIAGYKD